MDKASIKIRISGTDVIPETTRVSELAEFLVNIDKAISKTAEAQGVIITEEDIVSLTSIEKSSNKLTLTLASILLPAAVSISNAVETKRFENLPRHAHEALYEVSKQASKNEWEVDFIEDTLLKIKRGTISKDNPIPPAPITYVEGTTSIYGRCIRVGGVKPKAEIQLYHGGMLYIEVSEKIAREIAKNLYEEVCINGWAKWNPIDWNIEEFRGTEITEFKTTDPITAFKRLADVAKGKWDGVDAIEYVRELRNEGKKS